MSTVPKTKTLGCSVIVTVSSSKSPDCLIIEACSAKQITALEFVTPVLSSIPPFSSLAWIQSQHCHPRLLYSTKASRLCNSISLGKPLFEISPFKSRELLSLTANDFNYRWYKAFWSFVFWRREYFSLNSSARCGTLWNRCRDVEPPLWCLYRTIRLLQLNFTVPHKHWALMGLNEYCALFICVKFYDKPRILLHGLQCFVNA